MFFTVKFVFIWLPYHFFQFEEITRLAKRKITLFTQQFLYNYLYQNLIVAVFIFANQQNETLREKSSSMAVKII